MTGDEDPTRSKIKATVPLVVRGVTEKHTTSRSGRQLVRSSGNRVRVTSAVEDTKVIVARRGTKESVVRSRSRGSSGRKAVEQVGGGVEALGPEARGRRGLDQKGVHGVVRGPNHALSLAVLGRGIQTRYVQLETSRERKKEQEV
jgi:hypothetical protein